MQPFRRERGVLGASPEPPGVLAAGYADARPGGAASPPAGVGPRDGGVAIPLQVFAPFAAGYFLSYLFRTINGPLADSVSAEFGLGERGLGLLTSAYFLSFAACQLPLGAALDRFGPRRVQSLLLGVAAAGAAMFALAGNVATLAAARAVIGVGCAGALMAGLKALVSSVPKRRLALANGLYIMAGGLGATASTLPVAALDRVLGWRGTFLVLAAATLAVTLWIGLLVPPAPHRRSAEPGLGLAAFGSILRSGRFWQFAPASACVIGTAFAVHGLWAARWMEAIDHLPERMMMRNLAAMGAGLTLGAAFLGWLASLLRGRGIPTPLLFVIACLVFAGVQALLVGQVALPAWLPNWAPWSLLAVFGGMTALSYSVTGEMFAEQAIGRVNAALNVLHIGMAFVLQAGMGMVVSLWPVGRAGHVPLAAFRAAFALPLALQIGAITWFMLPVLRERPRRPPRGGAAGAGRLSAS